MHPTQYGRWELTLYGEMSRRALRRLAATLAAAPVKVHHDSTEDEGFCAEVAALLEEALRRKCARLRSVFPGPGLPDLAGVCPGAGADARLFRVTACWIEGVTALADDNELDVPRRDWDGRSRLTAAIVAEAILDDAVLAGRIAQIQGV